MAYWIHHSGNFIVSNVNIIHDYKIWTFKLENYIQVEDIPSFYDDDLINKIHVFAKRIAPKTYDRFRGVNFIRNNFKNPIVVDYGNSNGIGKRVFELSKSELINIGLANIILTGEYEVYHNCQKAIVERDHIISAFESSNDVIEDSPVLDMSFDSISISDTGDDSNSFSFDFDDDGDGSDPFEFEETKSKKSNNNKRENNNNLTLF